MPKSALQKKLADRGYILPPMPPWMKSLIWIGATFALIPVAIVYHSRSVKSEQPRIHLFQDMDKQPSYKPQQSSVIFADGRASRPVILETVARGRLENDDHYYRGYELVTNPATGQEEVKFFSGLPDQVKANHQFLQRGQERFNIYCASCHGYDGQGNGPVNIRATLLQTSGEGASGWIPPYNLVLDETRNRTDGEIYNAIRNGIRNMPAMGSQINVEDRWAIVAYVRALQISQNTPADSLSAQARESLK